jgi:hypothetical protein
MRIVLLLSLLVAALALAGCGSTSGPGTGGGSAETEAGNLETAGEQQAGEDAQAPGVENDPIFHEAGNICVNLPIDALAAQYGVEATPEAIAEAVAADYPAAKQEAAKAGCLAVLEEGGRGGTG